MATTEDKSADSSVVDGSDPPYPNERYAWLVVGILMVVYVFSFIDRQILGLLVGPIKADLGIDDVQMSYLMGFTFALFYTIFGIPLGRLADSKSRRVIIACGLGVWSLMSAGCGMAKNYTQLAIFRMGVGVGEASLSPSAYSLITDYFKPQRMGLALSVYGAGIYIGSGLAFLLGGIVVQFASEKEAVEVAIIGTVQPWQFVFFLIGIPGLLFVGALAAVKEPMRRGVGKVKGKEQTSVPLGEVMRYIQTNWRTFLCHNVGFGLLSFIGYGSAAWVPEFYIRTFGWTAGDTGKMYGLVVIIFGTCGIMYGGQVAGWLAHGGYRQSKGRYLPIIATAIGFGVLGLGSFSGWLALSNFPIVAMVFAVMAIVYFAADYMLAKILVDGGRLDGKMRAALIAAVLHIPLGIAFPLAGSGTLALALMCPATFFLAMPFGVAPAAIQEMMPNRMRGQASAIYLFVVNLIGLGMGPTGVAWFTVKVFEDNSKLNYSLLITSTVAGVLATLLLWAGLAQFRKSLDRLESWQASNS